MGVWWACGRAVTLLTGSGTPVDSPILVAIGTAGRNVGTVGDLAEKVRDLLVVGAGPAGVAAGLEARRLGLDALVVDKATFPRDKTCGDGLTINALRLLDGIGIDVRTLPSWAPVTETVLVSPTGREVEMPLPHDGVHAGVVPRAELDAALVDLARSSAVDVREGVAVTALEGAGGTGNAVTATFDDDTSVRVRHVVAADGHYSRVRTLVAGAEVARLGSWHAFRQYFTGVDDRRLWVLFEEDLLPGYAWVFPVGGGRANVGFGVLREPGAAPSGKVLAARWRGLAERPSLRRALGPHAEPEAGVRAWPIPAAYHRERLTRGRVLFAGDAGNVVDPMTGEGIAQALESGMLAARAVASSGDASAVTARYRRDVDRALGADLRFAGLLQHVLRVPLGARAAIGAASLTPWTRRNFARWMWEDYPRALLLTPRRWRRGR